MAALAVEAGENLSLQTVIQLGAEVEAFYTLVDLEARSLDSIEAHRRLWELFGWVLLSLNCPYFPAVW